MEDDKLSCRCAGGPGDAGSLFGRDLFASQREGGSVASMSRASSAVTIGAGGAGAERSLSPGVFAASAAAGTAHAGELRPLSRSSLGMHSVAGSGVAQQGVGLFIAVGRQACNIYFVLFPLLDVLPTPCCRHARRSRLQHGAQYTHTRPGPAGSARSAPRQRRLLQPAAAGAPAGAAHGKRIGQGGQGFYTRDARELEAHMLAQAYAGQTARAGAQSSFPGSMPPPQAQPAGGYGPLGGAPSSALQAGDLQASMLAFRQQQHQQQQQQQQQPGGYAGLYGSGVAAAGGFSLQAQEQQQAASAIPRWGDVGAAGGQ